MGIEITVAMAKRFMAKPEYWIQLDDLVSTETRRVLDHLNAIFATGEASPLLTFTELTHAREGATEPLARLVTILGRWGSGDEFDSILLSFLC